MKLSKRIKKYFKSLKYRYRHQKMMKRSKFLVSQLKRILQDNNQNIPVIVVSYNNGVYVKNTCEQLKRYGIKPIIIDNNSTCKDTLTILTTLEKSQLASVALSNYNFGHEVGFIEPIYTLLPNTFAYTDPDLQFNENLPNDFLSILENLSVEYPVFKIGFALSLEPKEQLKDTMFYSCHHKPIFFEKDLSIHEFESRYWINRLQNDTYELYSSPIDTTFAVYRKENYIGKFHSGIRVAGDFSAIHLPWFKNRDLMNERERTIYNENNRSSNWT